MIFFQRLLWTAVTNLFAAWIIFDANLWHEFQSVKQNITNTKYDFIIGKIFFFTKALNISFKVR